jgi:hypothetical protein
MSRSWLTAARRALRCAGEGCCLNLGASISRRLDQPALRGLPDGTTATQGSSWASMLVCRCSPKESLDRSRWSSHCVVQVSDLGPMTMLTSGIQAEENGPAATGG